MKMNFKGLVRVHTLPITMPLLPVYEAIVNSIQSIEDSNKENGRIEVIIERDKQLSISDTWESDIESIIIKDNGIGFTDENYNSFNTYASELKFLKGCKGVGRIIWLKAYSNVEIDSTYEESGKILKRTFSFDEQNAISNMNIKELDEFNNFQTIIKLCNFKKDYKKNCPKKLETLAREIFNHCFVYYVLDKVPKIIIKDEKDVIDLDDFYKEYAKKNIKVKKINLEGNELIVIHSKNYISKNKLEINLCAHKRVVQSINLNKKLNNISNKLSDENGEFTYKAFVVSKILDNNVNNERTKFNLPENANLLDNIGMKELIEKVEYEVLDFLNNDIKKLEKEKSNFIKEYVNNKNPKYRNLIKNYPQLFSNIPWIDDEEKLELELFKQEQSYKLELKQEGKKLQEEINSDTVDYESYTKKSIEYAEKLSDMGKSNLVDYVMHRKAVLDILSQNLKYKDGNQRAYSYEKNIHQLIFPMTKTSDDIDYMQHNLWIIDEKLAYHHYLASDTKLKSMSEIKSDSGKEPDIIIFDSPFAFTDENTQPYRNITIIEFKRPGREHYTDEENPIKQVKEYMDDIIEGKIKSKDGEFLSDTQNIRFFCYILCDINKTMKKYAKMDDLKPTPDNMGYYKYIDSYKAYMEIIPYTKLIQDSQMRNKILFDKLFNQI